MPLRPDAERIVRQNLADLHSGNRARFYTIADLSPIQLTDLNAALASRRLPLMNGEVIFMGRHMYNSRIAGDGYSIDEVWEQIVSAMGEASVIESHPYKMHALINMAGRTDRNGKHIQDRAVLECTSKNPRIELLSVIPQGDGRSPKQQNEGKRKGPPVATR